MPHPEQCVAGGSRWKAQAATIVFLVAAALATLHPAWASHHGSHVVVAPGQPAPRVGPSYLYPDPETTPGVINPEVTQANIQQTICVKGWTATIRPPVSYTNTSKKQQLQAVRFMDKNPAHYEEDHFISLELGGNPRDPKNLWPEMWGTPGTPLTSRGPFPPSIVGAKAKDKTGERPERGGLQRHADPPRRRSTSSRPTGSSTIGTTCSSRAWRTDSMKGRGSRQNLEGWLRHKTAPAPPRPKPTRPPRRPPPKPPAPPQPR